MTPDLLAIGHIVKDINTGGWRLGGSVAYATRQASRLGLSAALMTSCGPDIDVARSVFWAECRIQPSPVTTIFENVYLAGIREQRLLSVAGEINLTLIPSAWRNPAVVLLGPV